MCDEDIPVTSDSSDSQRYGYIIYDVYIYPKGFILKLVSQIILRVMMLRTW